MSNKTTANIVRGVWRLKIQNYLAIANPGILVGKKERKKNTHTHTHRKQQTTNYKGLWMTWNEGLMIHDAETVAP